MAKKKKQYQVIDGKKYLDQADLNKFESFQKENRIKTLEQDLLDKEREVLVERRQKLTAQLDTINEELNNVMLKKKLLTYEQGIRGNSYQRFLEGLKEKYEIAGKFGYDPDTGEIKE